MTQDVSHELQDKFRVLQLLTRRHSPFFCKIEESGIKEIVLCGPCSGLPSRNTSNKLWGGSHELESHFLWHYRNHSRRCDRKDVKALRCQQISPHSPGSKIIGRIITSWRLWKRLHSYPQSWPCYKVRRTAFSLWGTVASPIARPLNRMHGLGIIFSLTSGTELSFFLSQLFSVHLLLRVRWRVMSWVQLILSST